MKTIVYIGGFELPDKNAAAQRVMANAKLLREMGFEVSFIGISKDIKNSPSVVDGFESKPIAYPTGTLQWLYQICTFTNTQKIISRKPDYVILYNFPAIASLKILKACHNNGIKVIHDLTEWESVSDWSPRSIIRRFDINLRMRYCMKKMDGVIAISRYLYDFYKDYTKCILVPPTVDLQDAKWSRNRELTSAESIKLIYAGTTGSGNKDRLDYIIDALKGKSGIEFIVIGTTKDQYEEVYGQQVPDSVNMHFYRRVSHFEAINAVQDADFQMLIRENNIKNNAGFPTKFVESISCCTPLIATLTSNLGDYLIDGVNGFVVSEKKSLSKIFDEITKLKKEEIIAMKNACKNFKGFDYRNYKAEFAKLFNLNHE